MLDVMMSIALVKLTTRPFPSVRRPSSSTCSRMLNTSGCAFSTSSSSTMEKGLRRTASVSLPPSPCPTYPGGLPTSLLTLWRSMNSLMSSRIMASGSPKYTSASALVSSVFPTPVGPQKRKPPMGRSGSFSPEQLRIMARATAPMASVCPTTRSARSSPRWRSRSRSPSCMRSTGMPVQLATTASMSSEPTTGCAAYSGLCVASASFSSASRRKSRAASSYSPSPIASALARITCLSSSPRPSMTSRSSPTVSRLWLARKALMRARLPASSSRSMALSGM
mmetsp:Transcript_38319/g.96301  ORF Transcript_38319/g.96301 Transcript_38319/m.96301 type:complete len:280 (+) Transcript_38319:768-1607(+)